jgi:hypothetical protein
MYHSFQEQNRVLSRICSLANPSQLHDESTRTFGPVRTRLRSADPPFNIRRNYPFHARRSRFRYTTGNHYVPQRPNYKAAKWDTVVYWSTWYDNCLR